MPSWPSTLPQRVLSEGYQEIAPDMVLRSEMDAGPAKVRRRFTAAVRTVRCQIALTSAQVATLDSFYVGTLAGGSLTIDWVHPRTQAATTFRMRQPPQYTAESGGSSWIAQLELEILP